MSELQVGEYGTVSELWAKRADRRRFLDLGIFPGARIKKISASPLGDPSCYMINGTLIALRDRDAGKVELKF